MTGGIRMMLDCANDLQSRGHRVTVIYPLWPYRFRLTRCQQWQEFRAQTHIPPQVPWFSLTASLRRVPFVRNAFMPDADIVVATSWPTAYDVARLAPSRGRKVRVVMQHEGDDGDEARVTRAYRLPFYAITLSEMVSHELRQRFNCGVRAVIPGGVNPEVFYRDGDPDAHTVFMLYHAAQRKGAADGLKAIDRLRARVPGLRVRLSGAVRPDRLPDWTTFSFFPPDAMLRRLYSSSTVLLYPSRYEGFGLPPLEAMACGCPVVTTRVGAVPEFAVHGRNAMVVEPWDIESMTRALEAVLVTPPLRAQLSAAGMETAVRYSTRIAGEAFEHALIDALASTPPSAR